MPETERASGQGAVLVVEENIVTAQIIRALLEREGWTVWYARDGYEALRMLEKSLPRLLVLDINMSRPNGLEFLRTISGKKAFGGFKVLGVIMPGEAELASRALHLGVDELILQPFYPNDFEDIVRRLNAKIVA